MKVKLLNLFSFVFLGLIGVQVTYAVTQKSTKDICSILSSNMSFISVKVCNQLNFKVNKIRTVKQYPIIQYRTISKSPQAKKILLIAGIHANETSAIEVGMKWLLRINQQKKTDFQWLVLPLVNVDSYVSAIKKRTNYNKVDLNRNFPPIVESEKTPHFLWSIGDKKARFNPGKKPLNQPESQAIKLLVDEFKPDLIIALHSPYNLLDFDGLPEKAPDSFSRLKINLLPSYPGSMGSYFWQKKRIPVLTIEFPGSAKKTSEEEVSKIWFNMIHWMNYKLFNDQVDKNDVAVFSQGLTKFSLDRYQESEMLFRKITDEGLYSQAQNNLAISLVKQGKLDEANQVWEKVVSDNKEWLTLLENFKKIKSNQQTLDLRLIPLSDEVHDDEIIKKEITSRIQSWKINWIAGDFKNYLKHYVANKSPRTGKSYQEWYSDKKTKLGKLRLLSLKIQDKVIKISNDHSKVTSEFEQVFLLKGRTKERTISKRLYWINVDGEWRIRREKIIKY